MVHEEPQEPEGEFQFVLERLDDGMNLVSNQDILQQCETLGTIHDKANRDFLAWVDLHTSDEERELLYNQLTKPVRGLSYMKGWKLLEIIQTFQALGKDCRWSTMAKLKTASPVSLEACRIVSDYMSQAFGASSSIVDSWSPTDYTRFLDSRISSCFHSNQNVELGTMMQGDILSTEKRIQSKKKRAPGKESSMGKLAKQRKHSKTAKKMKQAKKPKRKEKRIEKIYGHELYKGADYEECGAEWFHIQYSNGDKECVTAVVVADEVPGMGAEYILDNCLDDEEDRKSFGDWFDHMNMEHALKRAAGIYECEGVVELSSVRLIISSSFYSCYLLQGWFPYYHCDSRPPLG
jgi:hypothetical protein